MSEEPKRTDERVRIRAYHLWERDGRPHGRNDEYWSKALEEIRAEDRDNAEERVRPPQMASPAPAER